MSNGLIVNRLIREVGVTKNHPCLRHLQQNEKSQRERGLAAECYHQTMYAQKFRVDVVIRGERKACPLEWLDQFCMRNFTNAADFDDTLPVGEGRVEASFRLTPERFAEGLSAWLTQRGKGEGQAVLVEVKVEPITAQR
jgi:hypothetical protein